MRKHSEGVIEHRLDKGKARNSHVEIGKVDFRQGGIGVAPNVLFLTPIIRRAYT